MGAYSPIIVLIVNILRVLLLKKVMDLFLSVEDVEGKSLKIALTIYCFMTTVLYIFFGVSVIYEVCNCIGIIGITLCYQDIWKKRLWVSLMLFSLDMSNSLIVVFIFGKQAVFQQPALQVLLMLICITIISHVSYPKEVKEIVFDKRQTILLIIIPAMSIVILSVLMLSEINNMFAVMICACILIINISVFYLYNVLTESFIRLRDNEMYKQQTYAYKNQLDVIMDSQIRVRAMRHDMKNHILALQALAEKKEMAGMDEYLHSMQEFMVNPGEYVKTGNDTVDSLLNYKIQRAKNVLNEVETKINIPEELDLHSFDLNVVLGNLLDNATEAAIETEEKKLAISLKLHKGILFLNIINSCQGMKEGKRKILETTKEDRQNHGIGLKTVQRIVEKYHGDMEFVCKNNSMETDIMMYIKDM